jgi:quinol monooxygenase YgiN
VPIEIEDAEPGGVSWTTRKLSPARWSTSMRAYHPSVTIDWRRAMADPVTVGLLVRIEAKPGREAEVESFLQQGLSLVREEPATTRWFGIRFGPSSFGIFDAFPDDAGRQAHLSGQVAQALGANVGELFEPPSIEQVDVIAEKPPR